MAVVGLVVHERRQEAIDQAADLAQWLSDEGHVVHHPLVGESSHDLVLVGSLGGEGSILRAVDLIGESDVPILGVNFGQLGYLTACEPSGVKETILEVLDGQQNIEDRMMLHVKVCKKDGTLLGETHVLNDVVVERQGPTVRVGVTLDGSYFTSYAADGLIVATPTGSTAYAFSAQGPIVDALHESIQVTPISAHMLFDRTMVLAPTTEVKVEVLGGRSAVCNTDGQELAVVEEGDQVIVTASTQVTRLVVPRDRHFAHVLKRKFGLEDR